MTLVEAVIWIAMFTIIMVSLMSTLLYFYHTNHYALEEASAISSGQRGIDDLVRTLREASYSSNGAYPIVAIGPTQITLYSDINADPRVEQVTYRIQGNSLYEDVVEPTGNPPVYGTSTSTSDISDYVRNVVQGITAFTYYDKNGVQISNYNNIADVRFVSVNLIIDVNADDQPGQLTLRSSAALRNLVGH